MSDIEMLMWTQGILMLIGIVVLGIHFYINMRD
jgi:hypothetical protein